MLYVEQACGRLVVLAGGGYLVLLVTLTSGGCNASVGGCLISGGNSKLFFLGFFFVSRLQLHLAVQAVSTPARRSATAQLYSQADRIPAPRGVARA